MLFAMVNGVLIRNNVVTHHRSHNTADCICYSFQTQCNSSLYCRWKLLLFDCIQEIQFTVTEDEVNE